MIGCGAIALGAHIPALSRLDAVARLAHLCDVRSEVAESTARKHGVDQWTADYHELLADPSLDAVIITTPEFLHAEQTIAALEAGKHVLCEKPIAATLGEADAMIAAAERTGLLLMIGHSRRFTARYQRVREVVASGDLGELILIRENERRPRAHYSAMKLPVDHWQPETNKTGSWKDSARFSGGVARGHAIHEVDLFRWFAGAPAKSVWAESSITIAGREVPDALSFQLEFENGALGACDLFTNAPSEYPWYHQLEIVGTNGMLRARDSDMNTLVTFDATGGHFPASFATLLHVDDAYVNEQRAFCEAIFHDTALPVDTASARAALEMALAVTVSAETGHRVDFPLTHPPGSGGKQ
jgi:predicted dehydrogenase